VTDRILADQDLRRKEQLFSLAFRASPALVAIIGVETGAYHDVNEKWLTDLGYTAMKLLAEPPQNWGCGEIPVIWNAWCRKLPHMGV